MANSKICYFEQVKCFALVGIFKYLYLNAYRSSYFSQKSQVLVNIVKNLRTCIKYAEVYQDVVAKIICNKYLMYLDSSCTNKGVR